MKDVWVFVAPHAGFPSAAFSGVRLARRWIRENGLTGTLTAYPLNDPVYEWAKRRGFTPRGPQCDPEFIAGCTDPRLPHFHFEDGLRVEWSDHGSMIERSEDGPDGPQDETPSLREVWLFVGPSAGFPSGSFAQEKPARKWIKKHRLAGTLTAYPLNDPVYDWAVRHGYFKPRREDQRSAEFIARFSAAQQAHFHFEDGLEY